MFLTCQTSKLASAVKILSKARQRILTEHFIIFEAQKDRLLVSNINDVYGLRFFIEAQVEKEGRIMLPTKNLLAYITNNDDEEVKIEREDAQLKFKSKHYKMNLNGYDDIPDFPSSEGNTFCHFTEETLTDALKKTLFCVQKEQTNPILSGLYFSLQSIASTDSYRLSEVAINHEADSKSFILPSETALILKEVLKRKELEVKATDNKIIFVNNEYELISRLIDGDFPAYQSIIPNSGQITTTITFEVKKMVQALRIATGITDGLSKVKLEIKDDTLFILSKSQKGDNVTEIEVEKEGENNFIILNVRYLLELLTVWEDKEITFQIIGNMKPLVVTNVNFTHLIMPVKDY